MSIKNVNQYPVSQLLDADGKIVFEIPKYQREYTWRSAQWESLFDDLMDNDPGYFLGTIICIDTSNDSINEPTREVVDGQQRLTTISLLLCALFSSIAHYKNELSEEQRSDLSLLKRKLVVKNTASRIRVRPQTQNRNLEDYKGVLAEQKIIPSLPMPKFAGNRRIKRAFEYFRKRIAKVVEDGQEHDAVPALFGLLDKVNSSVMVMIEVSNHAAAYTLFESLNNRGTPLTAIDLIKNLLLARLDRAGSESLDDHFQRWQAILEHIGDEYAVQERFFRHNYNAFRRQLNVPFMRPEETRQFPLGNIATRSSLLDIYEKIITRDPKMFLDELAEHAASYARIIGLDVDSPSVDLRENYLSLSRVQGTPSYILLLFLEHEKVALDIEDEGIARVVSLLISFFVRRNLTDTPPTRDLTALFIAMVDDIGQRGLRGDQIYEVVRENLVAVLPSDRFFEEKLRGALYVENYDVARFILCGIAERGMTRETHVDLWARNANGVYVWTVEHILPEGENIPDAWVKMIGDGDLQKAQAV